MTLTNSAELANKMALLRSHGISRDPTQMTHETHGPWYYQQIELGYNYRLTELQAALGISQMTRLNEYVTRRHQLARRYDELLAEIPVITPWQDPDSYSSLHLYTIRLQLKKIKQTRLEVFEYLRAQDIGVNLHYIPIHTHPYYQRMGFQSVDFPQAMEYYSDVISLPMHPLLTELQQDAVLAAIKLALV